MLRAHAAHPFAGAARRALAHAAVLSGLAPSAGGAGASGAAHHHRAFGSVSGPAATARLLWAHSHFIFEQWQARALPLAALPWRLMGYTSLRALLLAQRHRLAAGALQAAAMRRIGACARVGGGERGGGDEGARGGEDGPICAPASAYPSPLVIRIPSFPLPSSPIP